MFLVTSLVQEEAYLKLLQFPNMASKGVVAKLTKPFWSWASKTYKGMVGAELQKYGLRYDDLLDPEMSLDVKEALNRLPKEELDLRHQRIKRAMDLSLKHVYLSKDMQAKQTPFLFYAQDQLKEVEAEQAERALLGGASPYNRQLP
ncbi:hypothetical protein CYMTET_16329 [Cymbomonas tetramitiformis]|uniref:Complex III subunit VII n=1 Tax=Cymbomonas tetramitiformis TaxID=36881 RepID=A0AAE0GCM0_9CHLO|nr:hypothetical protein CYMTET_16329 [Cymbomonas tetramitiformis]|eukprot:gene5401-6548_t